MRTIATGLQFPEGPIAMPDGSVLMVEIARETLSRVTPEGRIDVVATIPGGPNGAAVGPDGHVYVCNNGGFRWVREGSTLRTNGPAENYTHGGIDAVDLTSGCVTRLYDQVDGRFLSAPNDIIFDGQGGFYFTDTGRMRERSADRGFVYYAKADGSGIEEVAAGLITPNGIGLSPAGTTLYVAETLTARLWTWDILGPGQLRKHPWPSPNGGRCILGLGGYARFDSLAVASSGNICVAALENCSIIEVRPDGSYRTHGVPDLLVTNLCFGAEDLRTAYVTLSYEGKLCAIDWHEPGLKLSY